MSSACTGGHGSEMLKRRQQQPGTAKGGSARSFHHQHNIERLERKESYGDNVENSAVQRIGRHMSSLWWTNTNARSTRHDIQYFGNHVGVGEATIKCVCQRRLCRTDCRQRTATGIRTLASYSVRNTVFYRRRADRGKSCRCTDTWQNTKTTQCPRFFPAKLH